MFLRPHFAVEDLERAHDVIEQAHLGMIVSAGPALRIAHMPAVLRRQEGERGTLYSHVPRLDPIAAEIRAGRETVIVFTGPAAYVSPRWVGGEGLPTYNHVAVHAAGTPAAIDDPDRVVALLGELVDTNESGHDDPWTLDEADPGLVRARLAGLQMFSLPIAAIEAKFKLSQNRTGAERDQIVAGLRAFGSTESAQVADLMAELGASGLGD